MSLLLGAGGIEMSGEHEVDPVHLVLDLYMAIRDRRVGGMLALLDPEVVCYPLVRPGQSAYYGHDAMIKLIHYMHDLHGDYQVEVDKITEQNTPRGDVKVTVQARIVPEARLGKPPVPVRSVYTIHDGLITWIQSQPGADTAG
jgi:hypothetical protein